MSQHTKKKRSYHISDQQRLRRACALVQSRQSLCFSQTFSRDLEEASKKKKKKKKTRKKQETAHTHLKNHKPGKKHIRSLFSCACSKAFPLMRSLLFRKEGNTFWKSCFPWKCIHSSKLSNWKRYRECIVYDPQWAKTYLLTHAPNEDSDQLRMRAAWSESSLSAWRNFASLAIQNAPSEDSDQTARMRSLIWIFAEAHVRRYVFCRCGLFFFNTFIHVSV